MKESASYRGRVTDSTKMYLDSLVFNRKDGE